MLRQWLDQEGLNRPRGFDERLAHAERLRAMGNDWFGKEDFRRALHCVMGAVYTLDFTPAEQMSQTDEERMRCSKVMLTILSNASMVFLKRGDFENASKAATAGLRCASRLPEDTTTSTKAKLLYRRAIATTENGPSKDLESSRMDLVKAACLEPQNREIRRCLDNCKKMQLKEKTTQANKSENAGTNQWPENDLQEEENSVALGVNGATSDLGPAAEMFAECVGRFLGRTRKFCRHASRGQIREACWALQRCSLCCGVVVALIFLLAVAALLRIGRVPVASAEL